eukprot:5164257-Alexandrium_andersonii.AAC.1
MGSRDGRPRKRTAKAPRSQRPAMVTHHSYWTKCTCMPATKDEGQQETARRRASAKPRWQLP